VCIGFVGNLNRLHVFKSQKSIRRKCYVFQGKKIIDFLRSGMVIMMITIIPAINEELFLNHICISYCSFSSRSVRTYVLWFPKFQNFEIFFSFFVCGVWVVLYTVRYCSLWIENRGWKWNISSSITSLPRSILLIIAHRIIAISSPIHQTVRQKPCDKLSLFGRKYTRSSC
jgi:hypothetical protein